MPLHLALYFIGVKLEALGPEPARLIILYGPLAMFFKQTMSCISIYEVCHHFYCVLNCLSHWNFCLPPLLIDPTVALRPKPHTKIISRVAEVFFFFFFLSPLSALGATLPPLQCWSTSDFPLQSWHPHK